MNVYVSECIYICIYVYIYVCVYVCIYVCMSVCMHEWINEVKEARMDECICMSGKMCVCVGCIVEECI